MAAAEIFDYITKLEAQCRELEAWRQRSVDVTRFDQVGMTTVEVARFLRMRPSTVRNYAKHGLIEKHPDSTDAKMLFNASAVLRLTCDGLKKAKRNVKWKLSKSNRP